jgi:hypothetical protein
LADVRFHLDEHLPKAVALGLRRFGIDVETHCGIAYLPRGRQAIGEIVETLRLIHASYSAEEVVGRLEWL